MSKVFRLHNDGGTVSDWGSVEPYGPGVINSIADPNEDNDNINITSIPSPFARIELYKNAFEKVIAGDLSGNSTYHKLVSQSLDIFQLFFSIDQLTNVANVSISNWSFDRDFQKLNNENPANKLLYDTLNMYYESDAQSHNLNQTNSMFFLKMNSLLIGSTAPNIMFMAGADLDKYREQISGINLQENHTLFSDTHLPLYKRQKHFIKYFIDFFQNENAKTKFPLSYAYLQKNIKQLQQENNNLYLQINSLDIESNLEQIVDPSGVNIIPITIGGIAIKKINQTGIANSDFFIDSTKSTTPIIIVPSEHNGLHPSSGLRLDFFNQMPWNTENNGKDHNYLIDYTTRVLPGLQSQHAWLGKNDFFEEHLVEVPFNPDIKNFTILRLKDDYSKGFLCPIKPIFFSLFDQLDLNSIEIIETGNNITISIDIPTTGAGNIKLSKQYSPTKDESNLASNRSRVLSKNLSVGIQNNFEFNDSINKEKTVVYFDCIENTQVGLKDIHYFNHKGIKIPKQQVILDEESKYDKNVEVNYLQLEIITHRVTEFSFIQLEFDSFSTYILPKLIKYQSGNNDFEVAIDFGTSNSYIAVKNIHDGQFIKGLNIDTNKPLTVYTHKDFKENKDEEFYKLPLIINRYFMPTYITNNHAIINDIQSCKFPIKSELIVKDNLNWNQNDFICGGDVGINYSNDEKYNKDSNGGEIATYFKEETNIASNFKWFSGRSSIGKKQVNIYLDHLFIFLKHYLMINNANFDTLKLTYTYPLSMSKGKLRVLTNVYAEKMTTYFNMNNPHDNLRSISESISPYYYYKNKNLLFDYGRPIYNIDIGGGTIDLITYQGAKVINQQSIRFGANELFNYCDMPYSTDNIDNFAILEWAKENGITPPLSKVNGLKAIEYLLEQESGEFESLMFDSDHPFKYYFLTYFSAIFYYIIKFNKLSNLDDIKAITFSGSGSKLLRFLDNSHNYVNTLNYFNAFAKEVYNQEQILTDIKLNENPKLCTAEGALCIPFDTNFDASGEDCFWLGSDEDNLISLKGNIDTEEHMYKNDNNPNDYHTYSTELMTLFSSINAVLNKQEFSDVFYIKNVDDINKCILSLQPSFTNYYANGVHRKKELIGDQDELRIDESLFFAAFPNVFQKLAIDLKTIYEKEDGDE